MGQYLQRLPHVRAMHRNWEGYLDRVRKTLYSRFYNPVGYFQFGNVFTLRFINVCGSETIKIKYVFEITENLEYD